MTSPAWPTTRVNQYPANAAVQQNLKGSCLLCGSDSGPVVIREAGYQGRSCDDCGIVYVDPLPAPGVVDPTYDSHRDSYYSLPAQLRLQFVESLGRKGRLLDVGCGTGYFLSAAKSAGYEVFGIDPNPECAQHVSETLGVEVEQAFIEETSLPKGSFDVVYNIDLLSHFPDPIHSLKSMKSLLRPDGILCFEVGIFGGMASYWYPWMGRASYPEHLWFYSEGAVCTLLERAGLQVVKVKRFGLLPSTMLSTIGRIIFGRFVQKPNDGQRRRKPVTGIKGLYGRFSNFLRYRVGAVFPCIGPLAIYVAARPISEQ